MKKALVLLTLFAFSFSAFSQETKKQSKKSRKEIKRDKINAQIKAEEEGVIAYKKHYAFGVKLISDRKSVVWERVYSSV